MKPVKPRSPILSWLMLLIHPRVEGAPSPHPLAATLMTLVLIGFIADLAALTVIENPPLQTMVGITASVVMFVASILAFLFARQRYKGEQLRAEELNENREQLKIALQTARMGTWNWDIAASTVTWSDDVATLFGIDASQFTGTFDSYMSLLPEDEQFKVQGIINNTLDGGLKNFHVIHSIQAKDGEIRWLEGRGVVERTLDQKPIRIVGTVMDITARVRAESERALLLGRMEKRNAHLSTAARVSKTCNSILDPTELAQQAVTLIAEGFELYYAGLFLVQDRYAVLKAGYGDPGLKMLAEGYSLALEERSMIGWSILHRKARIAQRAHYDEVRHRNPHLPKTRSEMAIPLINQDKIIGALTFQSEFEDAFSESDISILQTMCDQIAISIENARLFSDLQKELDQRRRSELEREALLGEMEAKNAELERFTYTVSHDLKSPLITIRGFLGHLLSDAERGDLARMQDDARRISDATNRMQRLLEELLDLSRVGRLVNPPENVPFEQVAREALSLVEGRIGAGRIAVQVEANMPVVRVDRMRLIEAIQNLLDNAAKFMGTRPDPLIEIGTMFFGEELAFFVRDNGIGIEPKFHAKVFGLFDKLNPATEGTGVGLALVKRIIEVHNGRIWLESQAGQGTTFYFTLPIAKAGEGDWG